MKQFTISVSWLHEDHLREALQSLQVKSNILGMAAALFEPNGRNLGCKHSGAEDAVRVIDRHCA